MADMGTKEVQAEGMTFVDSFDFSFEGIGLVEAGEEVTFNLGNMLATKIRISSSGRLSSVSGQGTSIAIYEIMLTGAASNAFTK